VSSSLHSKHLRLWDVEAGLCVREDPIPGLVNGSAVQNPIVTLEREVSGNIIYTGHLYGDVYMSDLRARGPILLRNGKHLSEKPTPRVAGLRLERGGCDGGMFMVALSDGSVHSVDPKIVTKDSAPSGLFVDVFRKVKSADKSITLSSFAVHDFGPIMALGSQGQEIQLYNSKTGASLDRIKYHIGFLSVRIGAVTSLCFHPNKMLLAAGAADSRISIYSGDLRHQSKSIDRHWL